jgi:hypothetical protein
MGGQQRPSAAKGFSEFRALAEGALPGNYQE